MNKEFLNESCLRFADCTREQQHILLDAIMDGNAGWLIDAANKTWSYAPRGTSINFHGTYRTKPRKKLPIPWEHIKPEFKFAAMDEDGGIFVYVGPPVLRNGCSDWASNGFSTYGCGLLNIDTSGIDWRHSLVERPVTMMPMASNVPPVPSMPAPAPFIPPEL